MYLPYTVETMGILKKPVEKQLYTVSTMCLGIEDDLVRFDSVLHDAAGDVVFYARNMVFKRLNK